jgi:leucyl-tRNA synthetase
VFQPIGFDSFGIHTENYALRVGEHPTTLTARTIQRYRRQLRRLGAAWDWSREVVTSDPTYYRWTQWVFLKLYRAGLAVRKEAPAVWCPSCLTVLAFEQLEGDRCERCGSEVTTRVMKQWFLRLTAYADQLLDGLDELDWPELAKDLQREWIGRSEGVEIDFVVATGDTVPVFTTRPDTLFGATFVAVAPDHPLALTLGAAGGRADEVGAYVAGAIERRTAIRSGTGTAEEARGEDTGVTARHPLTGGDVPVFVADYVVSAYGSGAIMGVPAHDERDFEFAREHGLSVVSVIRPDLDDAVEPWTGEGTLIDSGPFTALTSPEARKAIADTLESSRLGRRKVQYRIRDWLISRQRYWGPPIPIVYCDQCGEVPVPEDQLPVLLPQVEDVRPTGTGRSPLASAEDFVHTTCPSCGGEAHRETDVSDTFLDSAWYFLRYPSTEVEDRPWDEDRTARVLPVDLYAGGREHVVRHHLYARFVTRALHDLGLVPFAEPFPNIRLHGLLIKDGAKMSKSRGNVVDPEDYVDRVGADTLRLALLFSGDWQEGGDFRDDQVAGIQRFLGRVWRVVTDEHRPGPGGVDMRPVNRAVVAVGRDLERLKFNTAIARLMELARWMEGEKDRMSTNEWDRAARTLVLLLAPFAPHLAEELWSGMGGAYSVHRQPWPEAEATAPDREVTVVVQVDGRVRDRVIVPASTGRDAALAAALASPKVMRHLNGSQPASVVFVPDRLINLVSAR